MSHMIDVESMIKQAEPGLMVYGRFFAEGAWQSGLFIRENLAHIRALGVPPRVEVRAGLIPYQDVLPVAILVRITGGETYETWFNYHQTGGGQAYLQDWQQQARLPILFYTATKRERAISISNKHLADFWRQVGPQLEASRPWSMLDFDTAREELYGQYPTPQRLWQRLGGGA